ncbi:Vegetative incompatibility protein HET-E-1 [Colletotrichum siamense]|nr:Vegetative incompatibility protein HET-E-1 [Colletotrichum siamense]
MDENRPIRLLSLDGGGIRGVSSILVLKEVMRQVNIDRKSEDHLQPWQVFDLIGGTSTGGIIALMLGCLRMSVDECYEVYMKLSKTIFKPKRWKCNVFSRSIDLISANERYDSAKMEELVKQIIKERTGSRNTMLQDPLQGSPFRADDEELLLLRSYVNKQQPDMHSAKFEMWEALRATSAASTYFKEYRRGNEEGYVDGAFKSNNPIFEVHHEAADLWPGRDVFLISIGTGTKPSTPLGGHVVKLVRSMTKLATATEGSWIRFHRTHKQLAEENRLFRFSAPGIGEVDLGNYKMIENVAMRTETYLRDTTTARDIARCSKEMVAIQTNEYTTVHKLKDSERDCLKLLSSAGGAYESQRLSIETPVKGTCHWFLNHKAFTSWLRDASSALLWVTANPGCGKTVLSRFLVDVLSRQASEATVCYFFFKAGEEGRHHAHQALCAILHNVFKVHAKAVESAMKEYSSNDAKNFTQNIEALWNSLCEASDSLPNKQIIIIIDALDECSEHSRNRLIDLLVSTFPQMIGSRKLLGRLKIIVTSRPWPSIESRFRYLSCVRLRGENETSSLSKDIETMVKAKVSKLKVEGTITPEACTILETSLAQGADRTFLWASLVLETISKLPSRKLSVVKSTLEVTPASLDQLYETALQGVEDRIATTKMLQIILAATRPLTLEEINLAMNISSTHETVQDLLDDLEPDVEYTVKKLGGFFVRIMNSTVYLVHQTARDFLLRIKSADSTGWKVCLDISDCHSVMSQIAIGVLLLKGWPVREPSFEKSGSIEKSNKSFEESLTPTTARFFIYAAKNWARHAQLQGNAFETDVTLRQCIATLCNVGDARFHAWWYFMWDHPWWFLDIFRIGASDYSNASQFPLHLAAGWGYPAVMRGLIDSQSFTITSRTTEGFDCLVAASMTHRGSVVKWILANFEPSCLQLGIALQGTASADISRLLVDKGVDLQQEYPSPKRHVVENRLVLLQAVYDTKEKFEFLLSKGAAGWGDAVRSAAGSGKVEQLQLLLSAADSVAEHEKLLDLPDALKLASENGHASTRRLLLNAGVQEPEDTDISAGLVEAATLGCDEYNIRALVEDGARDVEGKALFSRASFGEVEGVRTLLSVLEYSCELVNAALLIFFDTYLDDGARGFSMKTIHKTLSSTNCRRLWNGFARQPMIGQSQQANEEFLKLMSSRNARLPAARFHQSVCCAIAMDEKLAIFLIENRKTLQESSDMTGTYEYLALACLWGRVRIIEYLFEKDTEKGPLTLCDQLFRAVVVSGNITALDIMLHKKSASGLGSSIGFVGEEFAAYWVEVEKVLGSHDAAASPLDIAARLGYQDMVAKLIG